MKQRPILIQGQMDEEIQVIKEKMKKVEKTVIHGYEFYLGEIANYPIVLSKVKVGSTHATLATFIGIMKFQPIAVINQGVAGAHSIELHKGDIVIGETCINMSSYYTKQRKQGEGSNPFEWEFTDFQEGKYSSSEEKADKLLLQIVKEEQENYQETKVIFGRIGSGDCWNKEWDRIDWFYQNLNTLCEDMETINVYQVCNQYKVPVIGIRAISNNERLQDEYEKDTTGIIVQNFTIKILKRLIDKQK